MNRSELRRLEKAFNSKNKLAIAEWARQFENQLADDYERAYLTRSREDLLNAIDILLIAFAYTLHFSEVTSLNADTLPEFMEDLFVTIDMFRNGEFEPEDYIEDLKTSGVDISSTSYKPIKTKIVFVCGNIEDIDKIDLVENLFVEDTTKVIIKRKYFSDDLDWCKDIVRLSSIVYFVNFDNLDEISKEVYKYAKSLNKQCEIYKEEINEC